MILFKIICLISSLLFPSCIGYNILSKITILPEITRIEKFLISFLLGWTIFPSIFAIFGFINIPLNLISGTMLIAILTSIAKFANLLCKKEKKDILTKPINNNLSLEVSLSLENKYLQKVIEYLLIILSVILFFLIFLESAGDTDSYPLQAIWGYKAMIIYKESTIPITLFTDPTISYTHQTYPLCFPIMIAFSYMCIGEFNDSLIKLIPPTLGILLYFSIFSILKREGASKLVSLLLCFLFCSSGTFIISSTILYAENLLLLYILWGVYLIYRYLKNNELQFIILGYLFLASSAWIKNEGLVYFASAGAFVLFLELFKYNKKSFITSLLLFLIPAILLILPWAFFKYYINIPMRDFNLSQIFITQWTITLNTLILSSRKFLSNIFIELKNSSGLWYIIIFSILFRFKSIYKRIDYLFILWISIFTCILFALSFAFSIRPLEWHMDAIERLLLSPIIILLIIICPKKKNLGSKF